MTESTRTEFKKLIRVLIPIIVATIGLFVLCPIIAYRGHLTRQEIVREVASLNDVRADQIVIKNNTAYDKEDPSIQYKITGELAKKYHEAFQFTCLRLCLCLFGMGMPLRIQTSMDNLDEMNEKLENLEAKQSDI